MARPGGVFCRKSELKKFPDPNCAGGCGVVPFSWGSGFRHGDSAALAARCRLDLLCRYRRVIIVYDGATERTAGMNSSHEKARARRAGVSWCWLCCLLNFYTVMR